MTVQAYASPQAFARHMLRQDLQRRPDLLVCSPKTGPCAMRVSEALRGQETNREATYG